MRISMSEAANIPATVLIEAIKIAESAGHQTGPWLTKAGLAGVALDDPGARVSFRQAATFLTRLVREFPERAIGIEAGSRDTFLAMGMLGLTMRTADSLYAAMTIGVELHRISGSLMDMSKAQRDPRTVSVIAHERYPAPAILAFLAEEMLSSIVAAVRAVFVKNPINPLLVQFTYPRPLSAPAYERFFGCPIHFGAPENSLTFDADDAFRPLPTADAATHAAALAASRDLAAQLQPTHDLVFQIQAILRTDMRSTMSMETVAGELNVTSRTLRRQLDAIGSSFSRIRDEIRSDYAQYRVRQTAQPIGQIAVDTGYSDPREFRRAYIRWTGVAPSTDRRTAR